MNRQHPRWGKQTLVTRYIRSARRSIGPERTGTADAHLGTVLAFVAGAINAGGFLVIGQYTSHMSGVFSALADNLVIGAFSLTLIGVGTLLSFVAGAACSAILINWGRRRGSWAVYAPPLVLEAGLLFGFGILGVTAQGSSLFAPVAVPALCFIMGLQNATVTKASGARIRTTHVTGIITDIGIELGKLLYWNRDRNASLSSRVRSNKPKLRLLSLLLASFFLGGIVGALAFWRFGFASCLPLALILILLVGPSLRPSQDEGSAQNPG